MYVHHLGLHCILFRRFLIAKINVALQSTKLWLKKVTTTDAAAAALTILLLLLLLLLHKTHRHDYFELAYPYPEAVLSYLFVYETKNTINSFACSI